jgi:hypothetical protein
LPTLVKSRNAAKLDLAPKWLRFNARFLSQKPDIHDISAMRRYAA